MPSPTFDQDSFRGRDDDVAINSTTFNGGGGLNANWTQDMDVNFRVRFLIQETAGNMGANKNFDLYFDVDGGGYNIITASTGLKWADTTQYTNGATTSQVIGSGTYVSGESLGGVDNSDTSGNVDFGGSDEAEIEFCVQLDSGVLSGGEAITLEVRDLGSSLNAYTRRPVITVATPPEEMNPTAGSYTLSGQTPTFAVAYKMSPTAGSYTLTGQDPTTVRNVPMDPTAGSYTLTGNTPTFTIAYKMEAGLGSFTLSGNDPTFAVGHVMLPDVGVFTVTGRTPTMTYTPAAAAEEMNPTTGVYTLTGYDPTFTYDAIEVEVPVVGGRGKMAKLSKAIRARAHQDSDQISVALRGELPPTRSAGPSESVRKLHERHVNHTKKPVPVDQYDLDFKARRAEYMREYRKKISKGRGNK